MVSRRPGRIFNLALLLACAGSCFGVATIALARQPAADVAPLSFDSVAFRQSAIKGDFKLSGLRVNTWTEGPTQRLFLSGDIHATLGEYTFRADRLVAWIVQVPRDGAKVQQVFLFLDGVRSSAESAGGSAFDAESLPVRAVLTLDSSVQVTGSLVLDQAPEELAQAEQTTLERAASALAKSQQRELNQGKPPEILPVPVFVPDAALQANALAQWSQRGIVPPVAPSGIVIQPERETNYGPLPGLGPVATGPKATGPAGPAATPGPALGDPRAPTGPGTPERATESAPRAPGDPIFAKDGILVIAPGDVTLVRGENDNAIIASGGVTVQYSERGTGKLLQLSAQRAVVFTEPGPIQNMLQLGVGQVRGIFLEGDVLATDGKYTMRGPQIYYDVQANKAVVLDAVFWTYDELQKLTLYVRAKTLRQTAATTFTGEDAQITNTGFGDAELSIGASSLTISKKPAPDQSTSALNPGGPPQTVTWVQAEGITPRFEGMPFFHFPSFAGDPNDKVLKDFVIRNRSGSGAEILLSWDTYALLGQEKPKNVKLDLLTDLFIERGPAIGLKGRWKEASQQGELFAYTLPIDRGFDTLQPGTKLNHDQDFRGIVFGEERWRVDDNWTIFAEVAYQSDPTFVPAFFSVLGESRREFTNALSARRLEDNSYLSLEVRGNLNNFLTNEYLLESQGYSVTKTPQITYARFADDVLGSAAPGLLTYSSEFSAARLQLNFDTATANEHGLTNAALSQAAFGINPNDNFANVLSGRGLSETGVLRFDTRHELSAQAELGPVKVNPFVVGRVTYYDNDFAAFSPEESDNLRFWGSAGVRLSTTVQHVYDEADSKFFDIHRLRHIIEPNATIWYAGTNVDRTSLPVYDEPVEGLVEGGMYRIGINQTFQTQRGGPGQWHNVDLLTLSTDYVYSTGDTNQRSPYGRFYDFRPEYSNPGEYGTIDAVLRLTDATSMTASEIFSFDRNEVAATTVGLLIRELPKYSAAVDLRFLNPQNSTFLNLALSYELTSKYSMYLGAEFDANTGDFQSAVIEIHRKFRSLELAVAVATNQITGETGVSVSVIPYGSSGGVGLTGLGGKNLGSRIGGQ